MMILKDQTTLLCLPTVFDPAGVYASVTITFSSDFPDTADGGLSQKETSELFDLLCSAQKRGDAEARKELTTTSNNLAAWIEKQKRSA
jgi:hypothetical protein